MSFVFDPTWYPTEHGCEADGSLTGITLQPGAELIIRDRSTTDHLGFFHRMTNDAEGLEARLRIIATDGVSPEANGDTGVGVGMSVGVHGFQVRLVQAADRRVCIVLDGSLSPGIAGVDWMAETGVTLRRVVHLGQDMAELTVTRPDGTTGVERVPVTDLPPHTRTTPSVEFGCFSDVAQASAAIKSVGVLGATAGDATLEISQIELQPNAAERVKIEGTLGTSIDTGARNVLQVAIRGFMAADDARIYPTGAVDFMPVALQRSGEQWVITQAERDRTGIQSLELTHPGNGTFTFHMNDARTGLAARDYLQVVVRVGLHLDDGSVVDQEQAVTLTQTGQTFRGPV